MALVLSQVRTKVYEQLGSPAHDLPNEDGGTLDRQINLAVRKVVRDVQASEDESANLGTIALVADQQAYDIPSGQTVIDVLWGPENMNSLTEFDAVTGAFTQIPQSIEHSSPGFFWRSDDFIREQKLTAYIDARYSWDIIGGKIYIDPIPSEVTGRNLYYLYTTKTGSVEDLEEDNEIALIWLACAYCCKLLANRFRGKGNAFTSASVGDYDKSAEWTTEAEAYLDLYSEEVGLD